MGPVDMAPIPFALQRNASIFATQGAVEDWTVDNPTGTTHHFHIHQVHFILLAINDVPVPSEQQQYYDTIMVVHGTTLHYA